MKLWRIVGISLTLALALSIGIAGSALALVEQLTLDELAEKADSILVVHVTDITYSDEGAGKIFTLFTLSVEQTVKGEVRGEVVLKMPGGEAGGLRLQVSDVPDFQVGERAIVFLQAKGDEYRLCGWYQGKYTIEDDKIVKTNQPLSEFLEDICQEKVTIDTNNEVSHKRPSGVSQSSLREKDIVPAEETSQHLTGWQTIMTQGFEGTFPGAGWELDGSPTWGKESYRRFRGSYSAWCAGSSLNPPSNYVSNMNAWLVYGPFSLADAIQAELNFSHWSQTQAPNDLLWVMASTDKCWFYGVGYSGDSNGWTSYSFDLTNVSTLGNLCGQPQVWIAFQFVSDASVTDKGVFIDDVVLRKYVAAPPHIDSIIPPSASAGTDSQVTIHGTNFGSTQGSGKVTFYRGVHYLRLAAPIVSWSDSQIVCRVPGAPNDYSTGASSGPVKVTTADGDSNGYDFYVTFGYLGCKWFGASPTVEFVVNENCGDCTGELAAIQAAFETWNDVPNADFSFTYGGTTSATSVSQNEQNEMIWLNDRGLDYIGLCTLWSNILTGEIVETDITFNDYDYSWSTRATPSPSQCDVQSPATHELGHALGLDDLYGDADSEKTMYGIGGPGEIKRTLHDDDKAGIQWVYPGQDNNPPNAPSNPSPANHATGVSTDINLAWSGGDPDLGDSVTYDVYFGTTPAPPLVSHHQTTTTYDPGTLGYNTKYYWKIAATDNHGAPTMGSVWDFTTVSGGPSPVASFSGIVTLDGHPCPGGTVEARVGSAVVGTAIVTTNSMYAMLISQVGGVPAEGTTLNFYVNGYLGGTSTWHEGDNTNLNLSAVSTAAYTLQVTISPPGSGSVSKSPNMASYPQGTEVTLTATPAPGYNFSSWSGDASGSSVSTTVTMNTNKSVTANFVVQSAPVDNPAVEVGFASISDHLVTAYGYKAGEGTGGWTIYNPAWPAQQNSLKTLYRGRGYWINVSQARALHWGDETYQLDAGWNLIGWLGL